MSKKGVLAIILLGALSFSEVFAQEIVAGQIEKPLTTTLGDPQHGRKIVLSRQTGLCILCHSGPFPEERFQGNLAPDLAVSVASLTAPQLRARIVNASYFNQNTIMPSYYRADHLNRVASKFVGQTILSAQEIEDVVAFLLSLQNTNQQTVTTSKQKQ
ncbi:sulfur oxidation c-type cytochrome SoxX [Polynucleobacter tropicus]|uniref:Sulfur oxidation c-type cytochrome SoxX n=1 Tax=Polynucleobacter tropicus TaxID=1743174 RepID=A0A6M9PQA6_9BURK|nr:sulfur oxidation c-type cytochrome SoxX [Polynucleobacter tropicus]QKM64544.1 sulfur oxidation c-type cytochrome SoxX [Polynucleobacter tropicus]